MPDAMLDHLVVDVRNRMEAAVAAYTALGFQLTPRGYHTLGSINHLAMFGTNYLELLGFGGDQTKRAELAAFPEGLNGLVFKTDSADATQLHAQKAGVPARPVSAFSRPVELHGKSQDAAFRTTHLPPETSGIGRVYFCEHLTPDLVWRPEWLVHPNGAQEITHILVATPEPARQADLFAKLFDARALSPGQNGSIVFHLRGGTRVVLASVADTLGALGDAAPHPAGRTAFMAAMVLRVASLPATAQLLKGIEGVVATEASVTVPARAAMNTAILFEPA
jgi:hypothetical protein